MLRVCVCACVLSCVRACPKDITSQGQRGRGTGGQIYDSARVLSVRAVVQSGRHLLLAPSWVASWVLRARTVAVSVRRPWRQPRVSRRPMTVDRRSGRCQEHVAAQRPHGPCARAVVLPCVRAAVLAVVLSCVGDIVHACVRRCVLDLRWKLETAGRCSRCNAQQVHAQLHGQHAGARPALHVTPTSSLCPQLCLELFLLQLPSRLSLPLQAMSSK